MKKVIALSLLLTSCSYLGASLTGGELKQTFTESYVHLGQEHEITFIISTQGDIITEFTIEPGGVTALERAEQISFGANARSVLLQTPIDAASFSDEIEVSDALQGAFDAMLEKLRQNI